MRPSDLALKYMEIFFSGENLETLTDLFADDLTFEGPFHSFDTAHDYIASLKSGPPVGLAYEIIHVFEDEHSACVVYQFSKAGISTPMAQLFEVADGKISKILLIFDTGPFNN